MVEDGFERFYAASYARLLRQLALVTGDRGDAEEVLQEAYGRAALRWSRLADYEAPEAWVRRVALRLAADRARRARRRAAALLRLRPPAQPAVELRLARGRAALAGYLEVKDDEVRRQRRQLAVVAVVAVALAGSSPATAAGLTPAPTSTGSW